MTFNKSARAILEKAPCIQCNGSGGIQTGEDDYDQCQFCYELRMPFIEQALKALAEIHEAEILEARKERIMQDFNSLSLELYVDESILIKWREGQVSELKSKEGS